MSWKGFVITGGYNLVARCDAVEHPEREPEMLAAETRRECMAALRSRGWRVYSSGQIICRDCVAVGRDVPKPARM